MREIELSDLNGQSELFKAFLKSKPEDSNSFVSKYFPNNNKLNEHSQLRLAAMKFANRELSYNAISDTMKDLPMTEAQNDNLKSLLQNNTLAAVTGQQIGFLGGPLYTVFKIHSAVLLADELKSKFSDMNFVPVFWIEDNDHDLKEASETYYLNKTNEPTLGSCLTENSALREPSGDQVFGEEIAAQIAKIFEELPYSDIRDNIYEEYLKIYRPGSNWRQAFIELLQKVFGDKGVLFISARKAALAGYFRYVALIEISNPLKSAELVARANNALIEDKYHIQVKSSDVNLFYHIDGERHKIEYNQLGEYFVRGKVFTKIEMTNEIINHPERFSPNALLRPLFQDSVLPTVAYIGGAAEIAYSAQISLLYEAFAIRQPAVLNRHGGVVIDLKTQKFLSESKLSPEYFFKRYEDIEKEFVIANTDQSELEILEKAKAEYSAIGDNLKEYAINMDKNLGNTADSMTHNILKELEKLEKKINHAKKQKLSQSLNLYKHTSNKLYPFSTLQERVLSSVNFISQVGFNGLNVLLTKIVEEDRKKFKFIEM
jgi:bacillithiol biosynthesis cysteine-adding enzyme BshC